MLENGAKFEVLAEHANELLACMHGEVVCSKVKDGDKYLPEGPCNAYDP